MKKENNEGMSLSKQRKQSRKEEIAKQKKQAVISKIVWIVVAVLVVGLIAWGIADSAIKKANSVTADTNYSAQLKDDGTIKNVKASDCVTIPDYNNISVDLSSVEYSDENVESDIENFLNNNKYVDDSAELTAADGDEVSIDYVGTIDGVAFDGGTAEDYQLTLGSGSFIDDFEAQIEGHHPGDEFVVEVTFPEDYANDETLAGCDAEFSVTLKGIYVAPEFTDELVAEKLSEYASTTEEYRQYLKDTNYKKNLTAYVQDYLVNNSNVTNAPSAYVKQLKANYKSYEYSSYEYMNQIYTSYYGYTPYTTFADYISQTYSMTEAEYDASLDEKIADNLKFVLACLSIAESEGITANIDDARAYFIAEGTTEENFNTQVESYGTGYMVQQFLCEKVVDTIYNRVTVK